MTEAPKFDFEAELKKQKEISLANMLEVLEAMEKDPEFPQVIALLRLKASFLDKKLRG